MNKVQNHQANRLMHTHYYQGAICVEPVHVHIRWTAASTHCSIFCLMMLFAALAIGANAHAQSNDWYLWSEVSTIGLTPSQRHYHQMVYDTNRNKAVLFGGSDPTNWPNIEYFNDTWEWDSATHATDPDQSDAWTRITPTGQSPSARYGHAMAYDSARQRVVLFGGWSPSGGLLDDTWEWDGATATWHGPFLPATRPVPRMHHGMAYDPRPNRQRTVLFGGSTQPPYNFNDTGHTWEWDGATWTLVMPHSGPPSTPSPRALFGMTYRPPDGVVLFGGTDGADCTQFKNTWRWDGVGWTTSTDNACTPLPPNDCPHLPRFASRLVWDSGMNRVVMYGGSSLGCSPGGGPLDETMRRDSTDWISLFTVNAVPRFAHAMTYDESLNATLVHGGVDQYGEVHGDTRLGATTPGNDDPQNALPISDGDIPFSNWTATNGASGCAYQHDLWYLYTATCTGIVKIQTNALMPPGFTPTIAVFRGPTPQDPPIECTTDTIHVLVTAGEELLIRLGGAAGAGTMTVSCGQQCPPEDIGVGNFQEKQFRIIGTASGTPWSWMIDIPGNPLMYDLNVPGVTPGSYPLQLAQAFVNNINSHPCGTSKVLALGAQPSAPGGAKFTVRIAGNESFNFYVGSAGQLPICEFTNHFWCAFNPQIIEIFPCVGDLDDDGHVNVADLFAVLQAWGVCPDPLDCPADLDGDGMVNVSDLFVLLENWGECEIADPPSSCAGFCGTQHPDGCWCDLDCCFFGDCCDDIAEGVCDFTCEFK